MKICVRFFIMISILNIGSAVGLYKNVMPKLKFKEIRLPKGRGLFDNLKYQYRKDAQKIPNQILPSSSSKGSGVSDAPYQGGSKDYENLIETHENFLKNSSIKESKVKDSELWSERNKELLKRYAPDFTTGEAMTGKDFLQIEEEEPRKQEKTFPTQEELPMYDLEGNLDYTGPIVNPIIDSSSTLSRGKKTTSRPMGSNRLYSTYSQAKSGSQGSRVYSTSSRPQGSFESQVSKITRGLQSRVEGDIKKYFSPGQLDDLGKNVLKSIEKEANSFKDVDPTIMSKAVENVKEKLKYLLAWDSKAQEKVKLQLGLYVAEDGVEGVENYKKFLKRQSNRSDIPYINELDKLSTEKALKEIEQDRLSQKEDDRLSQFGGTDVNAQPKTLRDALLEDQDIQNKPVRDTLPSNQELPQYNSEGIVEVPSSNLGTGYWQKFKSYIPWWKK